MTCWLDGRRSSVSRCTANGFSRFTSHPRLRTLVQMSTPDDHLNELIQLPETERARIAFALLDSIGGLDPDSNLTPAQFRAEMLQEAEAALNRPEDSMDWEQARAVIVGSASK